MRVRGNAAISQSTQRIYNFFYLKLKDFFRFEPDWYRQEDVRPIVERYYFGIRCILKAKPALRKYLKRCVYCNILFFTDPRNAGRDDVGCPFGCRSAHGKKKAAERDATFRNSPQGKDHRKKHNDLRPKKKSRPDKPIQEEVTRSDDPPQERAPHPGGPVQEHGHGTSGHVKEGMAPPDGAVQVGVTLSHKPAQEEIAGPDGSDQDTGRQIDEQVNEKAAEPYGSIQEEAPQPDGLVQEKDPGYGKPANEKEARPDKAAHAGAVQINGPVLEKGRKMGEPVKEKRIQRGVTVRGEDCAEIYKPDRDTIFYIFRIVRFVDNYRITLEKINDVILKLIQRCMDMNQKWKYPFTRAP